MRLILTLSLAVAAAHPAVAQVGTRRGLTLDGAFIYFALTFPLSRGVSWLHRRFAPEA